MSNPVGWFEIYVDEMPRAKAFYETVLGVALEALSDPTEGHAQMWIFPCDMENYGSSGALVKMDGFSAGGNSSLVYFNCENCATEESRVAAAGGEIVSTKMPLGEYGFCTLVTDTEGNMFGLHSQQ
ncbi:VOC family protein [Paraglaciecola sp. L1A13]|uniref:VOC family protein n=1 Tax=Paraglaciecola sp. L1A13 TaxID=2686359 RepID=UPI00131EB476|nr:VOC family protein [Paraglaciecola sp. L1A13]|tara:strand:+ start:659 stop:1036 length:378 start_codon:yes stop_codon:yes gene_type:complete